MWHYYYYYYVSVFPYSAAIDIKCQFIDIWFSGALCRSKNNKNIIIIKNDIIIIFRSYENKINQPTLFL